MRETLNKYYGTLGFASSLFFACMMWWYAIEWYREIPISYLVLIGFVLVCLNILALWSISVTKSIIKKKGKK